MYFLTFIRRLWNLLRFKHFRLLITAACLSPLPSYNKWRGKTVWGHEKSGKSLHFCEHQRGNPVSCCGCVKTFDDETLYNRLRNWTVRNY